ncbi:MAG: hypothetical protein PWP24_1302 [Clostridiales bacterium]|nr:hypothetical protein [Clostridiales bacterium]
MKKIWKKVAALLTFSLIVTSIPYQASADESPAFKKVRSSLYENSSAKGVYTYTVTNVKKGQKVKWVLTGAGKKYAKLKYTQREVKGRTSSNKVTIDSKGAADAGNAILAITAKIYSSKGTLVKQVKDRVKLKIQATDVVISTSKITDDLDGLVVGKAYDFDANIQPANTTSKVYWSVISLNGQDYSSEITSDGVWTPTANGTYTIKAVAKNSKTGKTIVYHTKSVSVGLTLESVKQVASNQFYAVFSDVAKNDVKASDFAIRITSGTETLTPKSVVFSSDGKGAYVTTNENFRDKLSYTISYARSARAFIASVGAVTKAVILTETVEEGKETPIEYALYDANNIDVKSAATGTTTLSAEVVNGYKTEKDTLYMYTVGKTANVTLIYKKDNVSPVITASKAIKCVEARTTVSSTTDFTLTDSKTAPNFSSSSYQAVTSIAVGDTLYAHFRALDSYGKEISYSSVQYTSADDNSLIIDPDGKLTPIKTGNVTINIIAKEGTKEVTYTQVITILEKKIPTTAVLSRNAVTMSNIYVYDYREYLDVTIKDQYGKEISMQNETCTIKENNGRKVLASYDKSNHQIVLDARGVAASTYDFTATFVLNGVTLAAGFTVVVQTVPATGSIGYQIEADHPSFDMIVQPSDTSVQGVTVRLKKYIGGIFAGYASITSATIQKDGLYYANDLTATPAKGETFCSVLNGNSVVLYPVKISTSNSNVGECKKAVAGVYQVTVKYFDTSGTLNFETTSVTFTDSQTVPKITLKAETSSKTVTNALALVNDCVSLSDTSTIYNCSVTGTSLEGEAVLINPGQKIHIDTISIKQLVTFNGNGVEKIYVYYTVPLDQTLTNKS